jgi:serine protease Do
LKENLRSVLLVFIGTLIAVILYFQFVEKGDADKNINDSLFVSNVHAQDDNLDAANEAISNSRGNIITEAVEKISPAIVSVNVLAVREYRTRSRFRSRDPILREFFPELFKDRTYQQEIQNMGSGFIISDNGYILTNDHVVHDAKKIVITMLGGAKEEAELIGSDPASDIALLKLDKENMDFIPLGNSDDVMIGEWAIAAGNPFGLFEKYKNPTVTVGVISAIDRDFGEMEEGRFYQDMIQTDASINHGNSGGPLCNALGQAIGMNTFIYTGSSGNEGSVGIGFAIPINRIKKILDHLKKYKKVDRDFWVGLRVQNLSGIVAKKIGYNSTDGVLITSIDRNSPAEDAGVELGDIILKIDQSPITNDQNVFDVFYGSDLKVGDEIEILLWREGEEIKVNMELTSIRNN